MIFKSLALPARLFLWIYRKGIAFTPATRYICAMFKRSITLLLLVALLAANFSYYFVYAGFELNKKYIATVLCENRDKPLLHCNGKCYFMKKIKQAGDKEKSEERQAQKNLFQEVFYTAVTKNVFYSQLLRVINTPYHYSKLSISPDSLYQPPQVG